MYSQSRVGRHRSTALRFNTLTRCYKHFPDLKFAFHFNNRTHVMLRYLFQIMPT